MNKKAEVALKICTGILIISSFISIILLSYQAKAGILEKESYTLGEEVIIDLSEIKKFKLEVTTPSTSYIQNGGNEIINLLPEESGDYSLTITHGKTTETFNFIIIEPTSNQTNTTLENITISNETLSILNITNSTLDNLTEQNTTPSINNSNSYIQVPLANQTNSTPELIITERKIKRGKEFTLEKQVGRKNVRVPLDISDLNIDDPSKLKVYDENNNELPFSSSDLDSDGEIDEISVIASDLDEDQTYTIIVITNAEHLDSKRSFISDIYDSVRDLDGTWSETIYASEYVRVTFERNLTSINDITVFPRFVNGDPKIEIYEKDGSTLIAEFTNLNDREYNKVILTGLSGIQDTFDLLILGGDVEFDHIIDPTAEPNGTVELRAQACDEQNQEATQNNFPTSCGSGSYPGNCSSGDDDLSCNDVNTEAADSAKNEYGGVRVEVHNSSIIDCDGIEHVEICYEFWGGDVAKHSCTVGVNSDGTWDNDFTVTCSASPPGVVCTNVTADEIWGCQDFFETSDGSRALAKAQAQRTSGSGTQTWTFDALFFNVTYTLADIIPPEVTVNFPDPAGNYSASDLPLLLNVTLNEQGSVQYNFDGGLVRYTMTNGTGGVIDDYFNATNNSIGDGTFTFFVFANDTEGNNNGTVNVTFTYDATPPSPTYVAPTESTGTFRNQNFIPINVTATDGGVGIDTIEIRLFDSTHTSLETNLSSSSPYFINYSSLSDGVYYYNVSANDSLNNAQDLNTRNFTLDTTNPGVSFGVGTEIDGTNLSQNYIYVNVTVTEPNEQNITFRLYNSTAEYNTTTLTDKERTINWSGLPDDDYTYNVTVVDILSQKNTSETYQAKIDNIIPNFTVNSPTPEGVNISTLPIIFNISLEEFGSGSLYSLDTGATNYTMTSTDSLTFNASNSTIEDGQYTVTFFANDSSGNLNITVSYEFGIDTINPNLSLDQPLPGINYSVSTLDINFTVLDENSGVETCWYSVDDGATNTTISNCQNTTFTSPQSNVTLLIFSNDTAGNINSSESVTYFVDSQFPLVDYGSQTRPDASSWEFDWIYVDVDVTEANFRNITYELHNNTAGQTLVNRTTYTTLVTSINWTGLNNNNIVYTYNVTVVDQLSNTNTTPARTLTLTPGDIQGPVITINSPTPYGAYLDSESVVFNISLDENGTAWYTLNQGSTNYTMTGDEGVFGRSFNDTNTSISDGIKNITFYTNDTLGNPSSTSTNVTIDTTFPLIEFVSSNYNLTENVEREYNFTGAPADPANAFDENFSTFATIDAAGGIDILYVNYTIPSDKRAGSLEYLADWSLFTGSIQCLNTTSAWDTFSSMVDNVQTNVTIANRCLDGLETLQIRIFRSLIAEESGDVDFYEEQVHWDIIPLTEDDTANVSQSSIYTNVKIDELNEANTTFRLYNSTAEYNTTTLVGVIRAINWTGLADGDYTYNITTVDRASNTNWTLTRTITLDTTNPNGTLFDPANGTISSNTNQNLSVNASDNIELFNATLVVYNSTGGLVNETTVEVSGTEALIGILYEFLVDGVYTWFYRLFDIAGNQFTTENRTIQIDSTFSLIDFGDNTEAGGAEVERNNIFVNVTLDEENFINITFKLYNDTSGFTLINSTTYTTEIYTINWTGLSNVNVTYFYNVSTFDIADNFNSTETRNISLIDETNPALTLSSPQNTSYDFNSSISLTYTTSDTNLQACWYTIDDGATNTTIAGCAGTSFDVADEQSHTLTLYSNDSLGLFNSTSITFNVNTSAIETTAYIVQRDISNVDGIRSVEIEKADSNKAFLLMDVKGTIASPETLQVTGTPAANRTALIFENYNEAVNVSWEYIKGPGITVERGLIAYNGSDTGFLVNVNEIDITESFIILNNRLDSIFTDAFSKGQWAGQFVNDSAILLNRSQSGVAGNLSWQVVEWNGASVQRGNLSMATASQEATLATPVTPNSSILFFSNTITNTGTESEEINASANNIIFGSVSGGSLPDTEADDATTFDIVATAGYLFNVSYDFVAANPSTVISIFITVDWQQNGAGTAPTTTGHIFNYDTQTYEDLASISITAKATFEIDTQSIVASATDYLNASGNVRLLFQHDNTAGAKVYTVDFDHLQLDVNSTGTPDAASTFIGGYLRNATNMNFHRQNSEGTADVSWFVIDWNRFRVERGNRNITGAGDLFQTINTLTNTSRTFRSIFSSSSGSENNNQHSVFASSILDGTNLLFQKGTATESQNVSWQVAEIIEVDPPQVELNYPDNGTQFSTSVISQLNFTVNDTSLVSTCELYGSWGAGWHLNQTLSSVTKEQVTNFSSVDVLTDGTYLWNVHCTDAYDNVGFNVTNSSFIVDTTFPLIDYGIGTEATEVNLSQDFVYVNVTVTELNEANITFTLFNSTGEVNMSFYTTQVRTINWSSLPDETYKYNVTVVDTFSNSNSTETRTITLDTTDPNGTLTDPENGTFQDDTNQNYTVNASDLTELFNATLYIYNETGSLVNETTVEVSGTEAVVGVVVDLLIDGVYTWFYRLVDIAGNLFTTTNSTLTIDTTFPLIDYTIGTEIDGINLSQSFVFVNVSVTEINEANITFRLYNSTSEINTSFYTTPNRTINWSGLADAAYTYNVTVVDEASNENSTETRNILLDTTGPLVTIVNPVDGEISPTNTTLALNVTVDDLLLDSSSCWWAIDGEANQTITCGQNTTFNATDGAHLIIFYSNDTLNNIASDSVSFTVSTLGPNIVLNSPANDTAVNFTDNIPFNYTPTDPQGVDTCSLYGDWGPGWHLNQTNTSINNATSNIFFSSIFDGEGEHVWNVVCNDTAGLISTSENNNTFFVDTVFPTIDFGEGTEIDGANVSHTNVYVNVSIVEVNERNVTFRLLNSTGTVDTKTNFTGGRTINWTNLPDEEYRYDVEVTDVFNRKNQTALRNILIDTIPPSLDILSPENLTYDFNESLSLNFTVIDPLLESCWYTLDGGPVNLITGCANTTINVSEGSHTLALFANDTAGALNDSETVTFLSDISFPLIDYGVGTVSDGANRSQDFIYVNVTVTELNEDNITFRLYNTSSEVNTSLYGAGVRSINWSGLPDDDYTYNVTIVDSASNSNTTITREIIIDNIDPVINSVNESVERIIQGNIVNLTANVTDSATGINTVLAEINGTNYTMTFDSGNQYVLSFNTSGLNFTFDYPYVVFGNDTAGNFAINDTGEFKVVQELNLPSINSLNDTPDPVTFGQSFNVTLNATDDFGVQQAWIEISGSNYSMSNSTPDIYNLTLSTVEVGGIGLFTYTAYVEDTSDNVNSSVGNITITEGTFVSAIGVRAANPDPVANVQEGRYAAVLFNPSDNNVTVSNVYINASLATGAVWDTISQGAGNSFPTSGWSLSNNRLVTWAGSYTLPAGEAIGFFVNISSDDVGETFRVRYQAVINDTKFNDPHIHNSTQSSSAGTTPFAQLMLNVSGEFTYNQSIKGNRTKTVYITLQETSNDGTIPNNSQLTIDVPTEFSNITDIGGTGWTPANINGSTIIVNTTQAIQNDYLTYGFNITPPGGDSSQGLYLLTATMSGSNAESQLEGAIKVFDGDAPVITLHAPLEAQNFTSLLASPFNYTVTDNSAIANCSLYGNWTGAWHRNQTAGGPQTDLVNNFTDLTMDASGFYLWNVECTDIFNNVEITPTNITFGAFLFPDQPNETIFNITQGANNGTGNITLSWGVAEHAIAYRIYYNSSMNGNFTLLAETTAINYTDTTFNGNTRRFYRIDAVNPTGQNASLDYFGAHVYSLEHNGNTRNWVGIPSNASYLSNANHSINEIINASSFTMWNSTRQQRVTCNQFSCPEFPSCTDTNCNFNLDAGLGFETNINGSAPSILNWSLVGIVYPPSSIELVKNATDFGKSWVAIYSNSTLNSATSLISNISNADAVSLWNATSQTSRGLIPSPFPFGPTYLGANFSIDIEKGYEVSVNTSSNWTQI